MVRRAQHGVHRIRTEIIYVDPCIHYQGQEANIVLAAVCFDDSLIISQDVDKIESFKAHLEVKFELKGLRIANCCVGIEFVRICN